MNNEISDWPLSARVWAALAHEFELPLPEFHVEPLAHYRRLIQKWNPTTSILSEGDAASAIDAHIADSWTLVPYCQPGNVVSLLDIGSGGGFPGIPLALALPRATVTLLDRSERKSAFLKRVAIEIALNNARVMNGSFPAAVERSRFDLITARAVEKPANLRSDILNRVRNGATFLCQSADALPASTEANIALVEDYFSRRKLRRSLLWLVTPLSRSRAD